MVRIIRRVLGSGHCCVEVMVTGVKWEGERSAFLLVGAARVGSGQTKYEATIAPPPRPTRRAVDATFDLWGGECSGARWLEKRCLGIRASTGRQRVGRERARSMGMTLALSARKGSGGGGARPRSVSNIHMQEGPRFGGGSAGAGGRGERLGGEVWLWAPLVSWTSTPIVPALRAILCCAGRITCHTLPYNTFSNHGRRSLRL